MRLTGRKKILYIVTKGTWGGAQRYVYDLAASFFTQGFDVAVAFGEPGKLEENLGKAGIRTITLPSLARDIAVIREIRAFIEIFRLIRKEMPDILHLSSPKAGGIGAFWGRMLGVPRIVYTVHGWPFKEDRLILSAALLWFFSWLTVLLSHVTITVSEKDAAEMEKLPFTREKIIAIHNGISFPLFQSKKSARAALKGGLKTGKDTLWLGMIAEFTKNKGLGYALLAFQEISYSFPDAVLIIAGDGEERELLERQIAQARLRDRVHLTGFLPNAAEFLKAFDVFIMSSVKEGLPYALLEAGAAALPVVSTGVGGIPEIVSHLRSGLLVPPKDSHALAVATATIMKELKHAGALGKNLRAWVKQGFSIKRMIKRTALAYRR